MKKILIVVFLFLLLGIYIPHQNKIKLQAQVEKAKSYAEKYNANTNYCVFVDFSLNSGKFRWFLWDFRKERIIFASPVAHGIGSGNSFSKPEFSNKAGSHCSSLGVYKIAEASKMSKSGKPCYRVDGLDSTNSNARKRGILIHEYIPYYPMYPFPIVLTKKGPSHGCFTIPHITKYILDKIIEKESKPLLLVAYI